MLSRFVSQRRGKVGALILLTLVPLTSKMSLVNVGVGRSPGRVAGGPGRLVTGGGIPATGALVAGGRIASNSTSRTSAAFGPILGGRPLAP